MASDPDGPGGVPPPALPLGLLAMRAQRGAGAAAGAWAGTDGGTSLLSDAGSLSVPVVSLRVAAALAASTRWLAPDASGAGVCWPAYARAVMDGVPTLAGSAMQPGGAVSGGSGALGAGAAAEAAAAGAGTAAPLRVAAPAVATAWTAGVWRGFGPSSVLGVVVAACPPTPEEAAAAAAAAAEAAGSGGGKGGKGGSAKAGKGAKGGKAQSPRPEEGAASGQQARAPLVWPVFAPDCAELDGLADVAGAILDTACCAADSGGDQPARSDGDEPSPRGGAASSGKGSGKAAPTKGAGGAAPAAGSTAALADEAMALASKRAERLPSPEQRAAVLDALAARARELLRVPAHAPSVPRAQADAAALAASRSPEALGMLLGLFSSRSGAAGAGWPGSPNAAAASEVVRDLLLEPQDEALAAAAPE